MCKVYCSRYTFLWCRDRIECRFGCRCAFFTLCESCAPQKCDVNVDFIANCFQMHTAIHTHTHEHRHVCAIVQTKRVLFGFGISVCSVFLPSSPLAVCACVRRIHTEKEYRHTNTHTETTLANIYFCIVCAMSELIQLCVV